MKLIFKPNQGLPVSDKLMQILNTRVASLDESHLIALTFNFRDTSYSSETGGFHPVEIRLEHRSEGWQFCYITDFAYSQGAFPELYKEVDFDVESGWFNPAFMGSQPLTHQDVCGFYSFWEQNFVSYVEMEAFNEIRVTTDTDENSLDQI